MRKQRAFLVVLFGLVAAASALAGTAKVLINHVGYDPAGPKRAVIEGKPGDAFDAFKVKEFETGKRSSPASPSPSARSKSGRTGPSGRSISRRSCRKGPMSSSARPPRATIRSYPFLVQKNVLERNTLSDVIYYFKGQRSSGLWDKADRKMKFDGKEGDDRRPRRLVRRDGGLRQAPVPSLVLDLFQSPADLAVGLEPVQDLPGARQSGTIPTSSNTKRGFWTKPCSAPIIWCG